jgi:UDP-N-acetylglucosamine--N-acetylmuramyl-(pentapeptide) pyrophosphoryl-undecaprenol N-acetylglucosamine transferase
MIAAAAALRIPSVLTEADSHLGLANRLAAPLARRVLLAYPIAGLEEPKYVVVGRPVAGAFTTTTPAEGRALFGVATDDQVVVVFGGSLGAGPLNAATGARFGGDRTDGPLVLHVAGRGKTAGLVPNDRYRVFEYCETMPALLAAADLVVCRAGGSVWEVAAAGRPAILVPWAGAAADHQTGNAAYFAAAGAALVIADPDLTADGLAAEVANLLGDAPRRAAMAAAMRGAARPEAARAVAEALLELAVAPS